MSAQVSPKDLVEMLNHMFKRFDKLSMENGVEKIKTIGDCYMAATGLPVPNANHALAMARFALAMLKDVADGYVRSPANGQSISVRVGIHSGNCVAGVIGHKKFAYDVWG